MDLIVNAALRNFSVLEHVLDGVLSSVWPDVAYLTTAINRTACIILHNHYGVIVLCL